MSLYFRKEVINIYSKSLIPIMTSNITPIGKASASSEYNSTYSAFKAFNHDNSNYFSWYGQNNDIKNAFLQYEFNKKTIVNKYIIKSRNGVTDCLPLNLKLQGGNDNNNWNTLDERNNGNDYNIGYNRTYEFIINNDTPYKYYRLLMNGSQNNKNLGIGELELWGYESLFLIQQNNNIYSITSNYFQNIGIQTLSKELFKQYGTNSVNDLCTSRNTNYIQKDTSTTIGNGKMFEIPLSADIISVNNIQIE